MNHDAGYDVDIYPEPERTSLAAIFGFIFSLGGCCFGVTAILGVPFSIFGLIKSSKSHGRIGGKGFAVAGLLIGLLNLALWGGCLSAATFGMKSALTDFGQPLERMFTSIESDRFDGARASLMSPAADSSDAELIAFRESYQASLGDFQSLPGNPIDYISQFIELGPIAQGASGQTNVFPVPATFDAGPALILIKFDPTIGPGISSITVIDMNGDEYTLPMTSGWDSTQSLPDPTDTDNTDSDQSP